jgi:DNA-binding SARP family transcriptional activator/tetratricopeptide (TPR) repeat protein
VEFRILGPLEIAVGSERLDLGGPRQQIVLAMLLLSAGGVVSVGRLQEAIYGEDLPLTSRSQAQISISSLRRLFASRGCAEAISTRAQGYLFQVGAGLLDSQRFDELAAAARVTRDAGHLDRAVASYRDALRLWRGPALVGIDSQLVRAAAARLDEQRITTIEDRLRLELDLGRHHELAGELTELVEEFPLREQLRGQLMLALYRCDRAAEALQVYRQTRRTLVDELGIEPTEGLQRLEHAILTSDPTLNLPTELVTIRPVKRQAPSLLPADIADFTGRAEQIEQIYQGLIRAAGEETGLAAPILVIAGQGGVGKTSIAVHASHGLARHFTDGQLFADLHGGSSHPVAPIQVLGRFLRALGVPGPQIPDGLDERAEVYRNLLVDRKILVVLDDAVGESQVSPLLPGSGTASVIVTSRSRLGGLAGGIRIRVDVFDSGQSLDLLARIAGGGRVQAQPRAAAAVAERCGHLPLALRIAGARLAARPHWSIQQLADRLADETRRLDELSHDDVGIRASLSLTHQSASEQARRLLRRLALLEMPVFSGWISAALLDQPLAYAEDLLDELVNAQLVETAGSGTGVHSQYRLHELVRVFARERLAADEPGAEQDAAVERALGALLYLAEAAYRRYYGGDYVRISNNAPQWPLPEPLVERLVKDPLSWYERERAALVAGVRQAAQAGLVELCWSLALSAETIFEARAYFDDWRETADIALLATRKALDVRGQAAMLYSRGALHLEQQRFGQARRDLHAAAQLFREAADDQGTALVTRHFAFMDGLSGRLDDAAAGYEQALATFRRTGDQVAAAYALQNMAQIKLERHQLDEAGELLSEALRMCRAARCERVEAQVLSRMGQACLLAGEPARAVEEFDLALARIRDLGDAIGEAHVLPYVGVAKARLGEFDQARSALQRALKLAGTLSERLAEARALLGLSELALTSGDPAQAAVFAQQAAGVSRGMGATLDEARALTLLSDARTALGDSAAAAAASERAAALHAKRTGSLRSGSRH